MTDWWHNYPWRLIQTNLREIDMQDNELTVRVDRLNLFEAIEVG